MGVEEVGDAGAGDDDTGVPVAGGEHAQAAGFEMERRGVAASRAPGADR
jgi:hypothetical protein